MLSSCNRRFYDRQIICQLAALFAPPTGAARVFSRSLQTDHAPSQSSTEHVSLVWPPPGGSSLAVKHPEIVQEAQQRADAPAESPQQAAVLRSAEAARTLEESLKASIQACKGQVSVRISKSSLRQLSIDILRHELQKSGHATTGRKDEVIMRLMEVLADTQASVQLSSPAHRLDASLQAHQNSAPLLTRSLQIFSSPDQVAQVLVDARCDDVNTIDIRDRCQFADYFIVSTARSHQHVFTAANAVMYKSKELCQKLGLMYQPFTEGTEGSDWVVVDAGSIVVHVFMDAARQRYNIEGLWDQHGNAQAQRLEQYQDWTLDDL